MKYNIGIDLGGTNIKVGLVDENYNIVAKATCKTDLPRPAEEIDVDGFVGVKSHRAKGKRLTTYDVATLAFVEPERPERPEPSGEDAPNGSEGDFDLPETMTVEGTDAEFEIERPKGDTEEVIVDTEQLNLF